MKESEIKTLEKYTQFTQPYPNSIEKDLELDRFPTFVDIELKNPTKEQLLLRGEESKRLNIIFDNNNTSYEDKNIKEILSNDCKNSSRLDDIYDIDLPNCFMRSAVVKLNNSNNNNNNIGYENIKKEINEENNIKTENKENNINCELDFENENKNKNEFDINDDYDIDIDFDNNNENNDNDKYNEFNLIDKDNDSENNEDKLQEFKKDSNDNIIDIEDENKEGQINESKENKNINTNTNSISNLFSNDIYNNDNDDKPNLNNKEIIDINDPIKEEKREKEQIKEENTIINSKRELKNFNNKYNITTLNIIGVKNDEYYIGQIIEKGPNFPSNVGIIKYMNLEEFSENYFGEKLLFEEIARRDNDFEKILKVIPVGNKKYIFNKENASKVDLSKEENDIIILHGRSAQETFYYIMKLTGQINHNSVYTLFKVKNNKRTIRHFKDSIGLSDEGGRDNSDNVIISEGINYGIIEDPDIDYYIIPGQLFLTKYRKKLKKEKEFEEKERILEEKRIYNENYEVIFAESNNKFTNIKNNIKKETEIKKKKNERGRNDLEQLRLEEQNYIEMHNNLENDKMLDDDMKDKLKIKLNNNKKLIANKRRDFENLERVNNEKLNKYKLRKDFKILGNKEEIENKRRIIKEKENYIQLLYLDIFCYICHNNKREVIFCECSHLMVCRECLKDISEEKGLKTKAICPACKKLCKRFFFVTNE